MLEDQSVHVSTEPAVRGILTPGLWNECVYLDVIRGLRIVTYGHWLFHLNHLGNILLSLIKLVCSPVRSKIDHPTIISRRTNDRYFLKSINIYWIFTSSKELSSESSSFAINQVMFINDSARFKIKLELLISIQNENAFWLGRAGWTPGPRF